MASPLGRVGRPSRIANGVTGLESLALRLFVPGHVVTTDEVHALFSQEYHVETFPDREKRTQERKKTGIYAKRALCRLQERGSITEVPGGFTYSGSPLFPPPSDAMDALLWVPSSEATRKGLVGDMEGGGKLVRRAVMKIVNARTHEERVLAAQKLAEWWESWKANLASAIQDVDRMLILILGKIPEDSPESKIEWKGENGEWREEPNPFRETVELRTGGDHVLVDGKWVGTGMFLDWVGIRRQHGDERGWKELWQLWQEQAKQAARRLEESPRAPTLLLAPAKGSGPSEATRIKLDRRYVNAFKKSHPRVKLNEPCGAEGPVYVYKQDKAWPTVVEWLRKHPKKYPHAVGLSP